MFNQGPSLADIAAVTDRNNNGNGNFGDGWWIIIILLALYGGFGGNYGYGGGGGQMAAYATQADIQRGFDTQGIMGSLRGIEQGICSLGYDQLAQMNGINTNIMQTGFGLQQALNQNNITAMQNANALQAQLQQCCCDNRAMIADVRYDMASRACTVENLIQQMTQQLMWGQQNGLRDLTVLINNKFCELNAQRQQDIIDDLRLKLSNCDRDGALQALYNQLVARLSPTAVPAYPAANPNGMGNWSSNVIAGYGGYNTNNGCGCGNCGMVA